MPTWTKDPAPCPVCGGATESTRDTIEGTTCESESRCTECKFWRHEFSYGYTEETIGFVVVEWSYTDVRANLISLRFRARDEMKKAYAHPDFKAMHEHAPKLMLAGWLEDHDFPLQAAALAGTLENQPPV